MLHSRSGDHSHRRRRWAIDKQIVLQVVLGAFVRHAGSGVLFSCYLTLAAPEPPPRVLEFFSANSSSAASIHGTIIRRLDSGKANFYRMLAAIAAVLMASALFASWIVSPAGDTYLFLIYSVIQVGFAIAVYTLGRLSGKRQPFRTIRTRGSADETGRHNP